MTAADYVTSVLATFNGLPADVQIALVGITIISGAGLLYRKVFKGGA